LKAEVNNDVDLVERELEIFGIFGWELLNIYGWKGLALDTWKVVSTWSKQTLGWWPIG
jgi:hypothetical protein